MPLEPDRYPERQPFVTQDTFMPKTTAAEHIRLPLSDARRQFTRAALALGAAPALGLGAALAPAWAWSADAGEPAPELRLPGLPQDVDLAAWRGKLVYVDFWASWCGPCRKSFPWLNAMQAKHGPQGLQVLGVNLDARRADADRFLAENPAQFALAFDPKGEAAKRFAIKGMPSSVLVSPAGRVLLRHNGFRDEDAALLEPILIAALPARG